MTTLTLISEQSREIQPLVKAAIDHEISLLEAGLHQTEHNIIKFEKQFNLSTPEFIQRYENNEIEESLDIGEWIGEFRMQQRFLEKIETLRGLRFAH